MPEIAKITGQENKKVAGGSYKQPKRKTLQKRSLVDPRLTVHFDKPNVRCCGGIRKGPGHFPPESKKEEMKRLGITIEQLLADRELWFYFVCPMPPCKNGRCINHGGKNTGRDDYRINENYGKYSKYLPRFDAEEIAKSRGAHKDLEDELSILTKFINHHLPNSMGEQSILAFAKGKLKTKIKALSEAFKTYDVEKCSKLVKELEDALEQDNVMSEAKNNVRALIREYTDVFKVEVMRRAASGEYISKKEVIMGQSALFQICARYMDDHGRKKAQQDLIAALRAGNIPGIPTETATGNQDDAAIAVYQDEESGTYQVSTE